MSVWMLMAIGTTALLFQENPVQLQIAQASLINNDRVVAIVQGTEITTADVVTIVGIFGSFAGMAYVTSLVVAKNQ